ncbi:MAG: DUF1573 domain-containing protein [Phycisphaerales bacterium]
MEENEYAVDVSHDAGEVPVNAVGGSSHAFEVRNASWKPVEITDVVISCGCLGWDLGSRTIAPQDSTEFILQMAVKQAGPVSETATLFMSNGEKWRYRISVVGVTRTVLTASKRTLLDESLRIALRLVLVSYNQEEAVAAPMIVGVPDVKIEFDGWQLIERGNEETSRPTRQQCDLVVDLSGHEGSIPDKLHLRMANGAECEIAID